MSTPILLSFYEVGDKIGEYSANALCIVFAIIWIYVMFKYLGTSDLNG